MTAPFDERLLFEHDLATPFSNLRGSAYLLEAGLDAPSPEVQESLDILKSSTRTLEKTLQWYWEYRKMEAEGIAVSPWRAATLPTEIGHSIRELGLPLPAPALSGDLTGLKLTAPAPMLHLGLLGAAQTLAAAAQKAVTWSLAAASGVLRIEIRMEGGPDTLDPSRLFRKLWWPAPAGALDSSCDPGLPYLSALLTKHKGGCELLWAEGVWRFEAWLPGEESAP